MPRRPDPDQLVGAAEIVARLGLTQARTVHRWRERHEDFPAPVARLTMGDVWYWPDVEKWARRTGRMRAE